MISEKPSRTCNTCILETETLWSRGWIEDATPHETVTDHEGTPWEITSILGQSFDLNRCTPPTPTGVRILHFGIPISKIADPNDAVPVGFMND